MFNFSATQDMTAIGALSQAQYISFSPFIFQATSAMLNLNILKTIESAGAEGISIELLAKQCELSEYGVNVLLDFALSINIVSLENEKYALTKIGYFLLNDEMTKVNFEFNQNFCYEGLGRLSESIKTGKPEGLKVFGDWSTLYPALTTLPEDARESWFSFDHFYSDKAFDEALKIIFAQPTNTLLDIGGNTGRWALKCLNHDSNVNLVIMDLPEQLEVASENIEKAGFSDRFTPYPCNMKDPEQSLYKDADVIWMSQFLDCFSPEEIVTILKNVRKAMKPGARLYIMETFTDQQAFEAASFSLNATSLYFTCFANGNSRMYRSTEFLPLIEEAGLTITEQKEQFGLSHTLLICESQ